MSPSTDTPVALVTGASRGIGRGIAVALAQTGYDLVINYAHSAEQAREVADEIDQQTGRRTLVYQANVAKLNEHEGLVARTLEVFGRLDVLVNNAGVAPLQRTDVLEVSRESYERVMGINLNGPFFLTQRVAREMIRLVGADRVAGPKIINIGSVSAYAVSIHRAEYCISKAGLAIMTQLFAARLAEHGINVYEVRPGIIASDMTLPVRQKYEALIEQGLTPQRRWGTPEDVGRAVVALVQGMLDFSTGQVINVDGGFQIRRL